MRRDNFILLEYLLLPFQLNKATGTNKLMFEFVFWDLNKGN